MIVGPHPKGHMVFRQMAHGAMAAEMTDVWGNEEFGELDSRQAIRDAELLHDKGWDPLDDVPQLDSRSGLPVVFRDAARADYLQAQRDGMRACLQFQPVHGAAGVAAFHEHLHGGRRSPGRSAPTRAACERSSPRARACNPSCDRRSTCPTPRSIAAVV